MAESCILVGWQQQGANQQPQEIKPRDCLETKPKMTSAGASGSSHFDLKATASAGKSSQKSATPSTSEEVYACSWLVSALLGP